MAVCVCVDGCVCLCEWLCVFVWMVVCVCVNGCVRLCGSFCVLQNVSEAHEFLKINLHTRKIIFF